MSYWRLFYHLVWATKARHPMIDTSVEAGVRRSLQTTIDELGITSHAIGFMPDHIHLALSIPPTVSIADAAKRLKGASARAVNLRVAGEHFGWQEGYGVVSFSERGLESVVAYVLNQRTHHQAQTLINRLERIDKVHAIQSE